ncbi:hypothetical protein AC1659_29020 [Rhodococcus erythropolis]|uniref:hypothetical protein n=1 Tax=Rhodococcus erythropolis TaxID=1833 RepID=UPI001BACF168|nr:hypothetical protein [Rhodococcus erythropolis]MBS2993345.1 hypothetical protein [Rhodococcus erythropolis]
MLTNLALDLSAPDILIGGPRVGPQFFPVLIVAMVCVTVFSAVLTVSMGALAGYQAWTHNDRASRSARDAAAALASTTFSAAFCALMVWVS